MQVIPTSFLRMFTVSEVNELLTGNAAVGIDAADLKAHTRYYGYSSASLPVLAFWRVFAKMSPDERRAVLKFTTGAASAYMSAVPCFHLSWLAPSRRWSMCCCACGAPAVHQVPVVADVTGS